MKASEAGPATPRAGRSSPLLGLLPYIGVILFLVHATGLVIGQPNDWEQSIVEIGVVYMIGVACVGGGISHIFFGRSISRSIGWDPSPFETEVGFANLGFGVAGLMASSYDPEFWLAVIVANGIFRAGAGIVHVREIVQKGNYAINNTGILFNDFAVPAFLLLTWLIWT
jgi:hypothetical protein